MPAMKIPRKMVRIPKPMRLTQRKRFFAGRFLSLDEAAAAFLEERDERREGRESRPDALCLSGSTMSFQLDFPLLVATCSPFQRIVVPLG